MSHRPSSSPCWNKHNTRIKYRQQLPICSQYSIFPQNDLIVRNLRLSQWCCYDSSRGSRWSWVLRFTPWSLYQGERASSIHGEGRWMGSRASLCVLGKRKYEILIIMKNCCLPQFSNIVSCADASTSELQFWSWKNVRMGWHMCRVYSVVLFRF